MLENLPQIMFEADEKNKAAVDADFAHDVKQNSIDAMDAILV